jgi:hypothetical protein
VSPNTFFDDAFFGAPGTSKRCKMCDCDRKVLDHAVDRSDKNDKMHMPRHLRFRALHFRNVVLWPLATNRDHISAHHPAKTVTG